MDGGSPIAASTQRTAQLYEITVSSSPRRAPAQSLAAIVKALAVASAKGEAVERRGPAVFEIARMRFNKSETRAILLIRYADGAADVSAHLVIDLTPSGSVYRAILEEAPGLSQVVLERAMEALARRVFTFYAMGAGGQFVQAYPRLSLAASQAPVAFTLERATALCETEIRPDVSVNLDTLLKQRVMRRAA